MTMRCKNTRAKTLPQQTITVVRALLAAAGAKLAEGTLIILPQLRLDFPHKQVRTGVSSESDEPQRAAGQDESLEALATRVRYCDTDGAPEMSPNGSGNDTEATANKSDPEHPALSAGHDEGLPAYSGSHVDDIAEREDDQVGPSTFIELAEQEAEKQPAGQREHGEQRKSRDYGNAGA